MKPLTSRLPLAPSAPVVAITITGLASSLAQIIMVRELLVLFYGNELSTGLLFTCWLLWTAAGSGLAGRCSQRLAPTPTALAANLLALALLFPASLLWIRATRLIWNIPLGEVLPPDKMLLIAFTTTGPFCLAAGFAFALTWALQARDADGKQSKPLHIYLGEAAGSALGGLLLYFLVLPHWPVVAAVLISALLLTLTAVYVLWPHPGRRGSAPAILLSGVALTCCIGLIAAFFFVPHWEKITRRWQWGAQVMTVRDTPYHNLALIQQEGQVTLFANGLWLFSAPDPQTAEQTVHLALLQHAEPRSVLLVGGGIAGLLAEILKHPSVLRIDYVEPDPEIIRLAEQSFPPEVTAALHSPLVHLTHDDAGSFIGRTPRRYDVILLDVGEPMNIQMNRFYTVEFYRRLGRLLNPGGFFSFAPGASADMVGPVQARFLRSVAATLRSAFPQIMIIPGENARFLATDQLGRLISDPQELAERIRHRNLELQYVRADTLADTLQPLRLQALAGIIAPQSGQELNLDFTPLCYFNNLLVWGAQLHPGLNRMLLAAAGLARPWLWGLVAVGALYIVWLFWGGPARPRAAVGLSVLVVGGMLMTVEIVLLLAFQVFAGFVYTQLALIIAFFMVGLALGAAIFSWLDEWWVKHPCRWLFAVQVGLCGYLGALMNLLLVLHERLQASTAVAAGLPLPLVFALLALLTGLLGGLHFSLAVKTLAGSTIPSAKTGGGLYGLDLLGAALGALLASLVLLPITGLITTLGFCVALGCGSALALLRATA